MAKKGSEWAARIKGEVQKSIIGQDVVIERLLVALLSNGHVLLEGLPGLAKTLLIKSLGSAMGLDFERIQFTPDLLPLRLGLNSPDRYNPPRQKYGVDWWYSNHPPRSLLCRF